MGGTGLTWARGWLRGLALAALLGLAAATAWAGQEGHCRQCHLAGQVRVLGQLAWQAPLEQERLTPCPGRQALQEDLWATESLLGGLAAQLPGLARQGFYVAPWRQTLHQARAALSQALAEPLEEGWPAGRKLALVRRLVREGALTPMLERSYQERRHLWWGLLLLGALLLALAWLRGWRRGLPADPAERVFNRIKARKLPW